MIVPIIVAIIMLVGIPAIFIDDVLLTWLYAIYAIALVIALIVSASKRSASLRRFGHGFAIVSTTMLLVVLILSVIAIDRGLWTLNAPAGTAIRSVASGDTPRDQSEEAQGKTNCVIAFFRFGCPDCEATHDELVEWLDDNNIIAYWVSTRSKLGRQMFLNSGVSEVPSLMAVDSNGDTTAYVVYEFDEDNNPIMDYDALDRVLKALDER